MTTDSHPYPGPARPLADVRAELEHRRAGGPVLVTDPELAAAMAAAVEASAGPLAAYVDAFRAELSGWVARTPGGVASPDERGHATAALAMLDALLQESTVIRVKLIREIRANDDRHMAVLSRARELAVEQAEAELGAAVCARCGTPGGVYVEASAAALDVAPGALICHNRIACRERQQQQPLGGEPMSAEQAIADTIGGALRAQEADSAGGQA